MLVIFCSLPCVSQTQKPIYVDGVNVYTKPKIYADSFDGFVNMRSLPSSKGNIVGKFRNGQVPGYAIKQEGNWIKIYYKGLTGYVYKKYTTSKPTIEVTVDVEGSWIEGLWGNNGYTVYMFFDNGTYEYRTDKWDTLIGTYSHIVKSGDVLKNVKENLKLNISVEELYENIKVNVANNTQILEILVQHEDSYKAKIIADEVSEVFAEKVNYLAI